MEGSYAAGTYVTISASPAAPGYQFTGWTGPTAALVLNDASSSQTTLTMPTAAATFTATYGIIPTTYTVTVNGGTGSGSYAAGTQLIVTANAPASGSYFSGWTGSTTSLASSAFSSTTLTVPVGGATITAGYSPGTTTYAVTVTNGSGSGTYLPGTAVTITANAPPNGDQFTGWTGSTSTLTNALAPTTTLNVPTDGASVTANYAAIPSTPKLILAAGLERIVPGYNGPAIRIRRPSDNTEEDIGFAAGSNNLDTAAVTAFLGHTQGWITTLYAQDGSGNNLGTPLPTSTESMPTIWIDAPTTIMVNGSPNLTARNVVQPYSYEQGNLRYFVIPPSVSLNKAQASVFLAARIDYSGDGNGDPYMSLYELGDPSADAVDIMTTQSGLQGLSHNKVVTFQNNHVDPRSQPTVIGLVSSPSAVPVIYLDGVAHSAADVTGSSVTGPTAPANCGGGYLMAGTGTGNYYGIPLDAGYNFLAFAVYSGTVDATEAATISNALLPRTVPAYNVLIDGDSITQGTGSIYDYNMAHYVEPLLNAPADITNIAIYGYTASGAPGETTYPSPATSIGGISYNPKATANIYYLDIGTNDIHEGATGATTFNNVVSALQGAKALGYKTIGATLLHENGESSTASNEIDNFNTLIRAAASQHASYLDELADYQADPRLGIVSNYYPNEPVYSADGTHPNDAGYQIMAGIVAPLFNQIIQAPTAPNLVSAASVQNHAGTPFSINLPLTGDPGVECRAINKTMQVVLTFDQPVTSGNVSISNESEGLADTISVGTPTFSGDTMTVTLQKVDDQQTFTLNVAALNGSSGTAAVDISVLEGDVNGNGVVDAHDLTQVRNATGDQIGDPGFEPQDDITEDGVVAAQDLTQVRNRVGNQLP